MPVTKLFFLMIRRPPRSTPEFFVAADGLVGGMAVFPERIYAVSSASNIAACFETTSMATKPAFGFSDVDKAIGDVVIDTFFDDMTR